MQLFRCRNQNEDSSIAKHSSFPHSGYETSDTVRASHRPSWPSSMFWANADRFGAAMLGINHSTPPPIRAGYMGIYQCVTETGQQPFGMPPHIHPAKRAPDKLIDPHVASADGRWGRIVNAEHGS